MSDVPTFAAFYRAVHHRDPLPWQQRLAVTIAERGWPDEIGVPTGLGKTATLDVAVWALAAQAKHEPSARTAPTRTWYVVDRRLLVDAAYEHGCRLARLLADADDGPLADVAAALRQLAGTAETGEPLQISRLRGGEPLGARTTHPAQPAVCFSTVAMYASRLLFRGYGTSRRMHPVDAALAGTDALVLLDEAHLAPALVDLLASTRACDAGDPTTVLTPTRARPQLVALTATGRSSDRFDLNDEDHAHPIVQRRLDAAKPTRLIETTKARLPRALADTAVELVGHQEPRTCLVFVNTPDLAARTAEALTTRTAAREVMVLTGRLRAREAQTVRDRLLADDGMPATGTHRERDRPLFVVATQTLEVGADLDADCLVTETAGVRALTQRFGRLNRLGARPDAAAAIVHPTDQTGWPVYGTEPAAVWNRLTNTAAHDRVELSPRRIAEVLGEPADAPGRVGELLPAHLWEYAKTTLPPHREAPVEVFFNPLDEEPPPVSVAWRAWLAAAGERCVPAPAPGEFVDVPIGQLREWLAARTDQPSLARIAADGITIERPDPADLRPGDAILLPADHGGYDPLVGFDPTATGPVLDVSPWQRHELVLNAATIRHLAPQAAADELRAALSSLQPSHPDGRVDAADRRAAIEAVAALLAAHDPPPSVTFAEWDELRAGVAAASPAVPQPGSSVTARWARRGRPAAAPAIASDFFDDLSFDATATTLAAHHDTVAELTTAFATAIGLPERIRDNLVEAAAAHDAGKADPRFQRWLAPDGAETLLAKSAAAHTSRPPEAAGWPSGGRHELLSARLAQHALTDHGHNPARDPALLTHLISSHHGHGRPSVPTVTDPMPTTVHTEILGHTVQLTADLSVPDWSQPARFRHLCEHYGYWGLALIESVLRQADHHASRATEVA